MTILLAGLALLATATTARPEGLPVPQNALVALVAKGQGVQVYACSAEGSRAAWKAVGPEAVLTDTEGKRIGRHYAGPSWQAADGGVVTGAVIAKSASPQGDGVDWLLLRAVTAPDKGALAHVSYVERQKTSGGLPPARGCVAGDVGQQVRVPYSAEYDFYVPAPPPKPGRKDEVTPPGR